jgi:prolyl-tRNA synthetase
MVDQSPVKGCMVIRPWGMAVWDELKDDLNRRIKGKGVQNAYFPLFIPMSFLSKEVCIYIVCVCASCVRV